MAAALPPPNSADRASALVFFALPGFFFAAICRLCHSSCGRVCVILAPGRAARFVCGAFTFAPGVGRGGDAPDAWGGREASDPASPAAVARMPLTLRFDVAARALCCQRCGSTGVWLPGVSTARRRRRPKIGRGVRAIPSLTRRRRRPGQACSRSRRRRFGIPRTVDRRLAR